MRRFGNPESIRDRQAGMTFGVYLESVHKVRFFVIPAEAGIQNLLKTMDSGLRTAGMTESKLIDSLKKCHSRESVLRIDGGNPVYSRRSGCRIIRLPY